MVDLDKMSFEMLESVRTNPLTEMLQYSSTFTPLLFAARLTRAAGHNFELLTINCKLISTPQTGLRQLNICATRRSNVRHVCVP